MNQICQLRYLIIEERVGLLCILLVKMMILSIHQPLSFGKEITKCLKQTDSSGKMWQNRSTEPSWHLGKTKGLLDVWCPPVQSSFLPNLKPLTKCPKKAASLVCQHCETCPEEEKENLSCVNLILFSSFVLPLPLPLLFLSVLQDPLLSNLWTPYEHVTSRATVKWR